MRKLYDAEISSESVVRVSLKLMKILCFRSVSYIGKLTPDINQFKNALVY